MKKFLCLVLALVISSSFMIGCSNDNTNASPDLEQSDVVPSDTANSETPKESENVPENTGEKSVNNPATQPKNPVASSKVLSSENLDDKPDIYFISTGGSDADSISYHLKDCSALSGKEYQKISWEMVTALGFRNCAKCTPPKYEGYIE